MHQILATLATCHSFALQLFCSSWAAAQPNMEAEISGYLSHPASLLALVGTSDVGFSQKLPKVMILPMSVQLQCSINSFFLLLGILRIAASLTAAGPGLDWPPPLADVLDPFAQERFWSVPDLNRVVQDLGRGKTWRERISR